MTNNLLKSKRASALAKVGIDLGMGAIFMLAIGLTITVTILGNLTTPGACSTTHPAALGGITKTVADYAPLIIIAGFIYFVARIFGII